jgi:hypothetical protein
LITGFDLIKLFGVNLLMLFGNYKQILIFLYCKKISILKGICILETLTMLSYERKTYEFDLIGVETLMEPNYNGRLTTLSAKARLTIVISIK